MKKSALWVTVLVAGLGLMLLSYYVLQSPQRAALKAKLALSKGASQAATETATAPQKKKAKIDKEWRDPATRVPAGAFQVYMGGMALLLTGGSALLLRLWGFLSARTPIGMLRSPLLEARRYWRWLVLLHVAYFGAMILFMEIVYAAPDVQREILTAIKQEVEGGKGPLGVVGSAYRNHNILLAAVMTVTLNFLGGSVLCITIPSIIVPGAGVLVAAVRSIVWGLLLSPTHVALSGVMLPHSFTVWLEGEGYILASFFAILVPVYLLRASEGPTVGDRYAKAILLNLKGNLWVLIVLAVSALYEAVEVIWMRTH